MNLRPPGYEPDELPTALLRDIEFVWLGAGGRTRTGTVLLPGDFKSPVSTIPPHRRILAMIRIPYLAAYVNPFFKNAPIFLPTFLSKKRADDLKRDHRCVPCCLICGSAPFLSCNRRAGRKDRRDGGCFASQTVSGWTLRHLGYRRSRSRRQICRRAHGKRCWP